MGSARRISLLTDRPSRANETPRLPWSQAAQVGDVLRPQRVVQAELAGDGRDRLGAGVGPGDQAGRVARHDVGEQERQRHDAEDHDEHLRQAPDQPAAHRLVSAVAGSSRSVSQSPARLKASTVMISATPGAISSQGAVWKYCWPSDTIWPQEAWGSGTPMPR